MACVRVLGRMKRVLVLFMTAVLVCITAVPAAAAMPSETVTSGYTALNYSPQSAMWISFLEFQSMLKGKSQKAFTQSVQTMYNNCVEMGINTLYVHARSHSDAFYQSDYYPWSKNVTGTLGQKPNFDPFKILVDEAHKRGLSIHAWVNPMRGVTDKEMPSVPDSYPMKKWYNDAKKRGTYIVKVDGTWYCNPAYTEVRQLINNGVREILVKYKVDGVHIDDYFYPTTDKSFDAAAFAADGRGKTLDQWRLDTVSNMVAEMYKTVKSANKTALFGVSPQGNIDNNYQTQYADVRKWASAEGYLDYLVPQIYFGFKNKTQPYSTNLSNWMAMTTAPNVELVVGLAPYKIGTDDSAGEWKGEQQIIARQVRTFQGTDMYGGAAFFRYDSLFAPAKSVSSQVKAELEAIKAALK